MRKKLQSSSPSAPDPLNQFDLLKQPIGGVGPLMATASAGSHPIHGPFAPVVSIEETSDNELLKRIRRLDQKIAPLLPGRPRSNDGNHFG
jgi:hypothetical protein